MTITNQYAGYCSCGARVGERQGTANKVGGKWQVRCARCTAGSAPASSPTPAKPRRSSAPRVRREPPPAGPDLRNDRDAYHVGDVRVAQLSAAEIIECEARQSVGAIEVPGEPCKRAGDRRVAVVVIHTSRMSQSDADDNGYCGRFGAIVRLATADEAAPIVAERAAKVAAKTDAAAKAQAWSAQLAELTAGRILVEGGSIDRVGAEILHEERKGLHGTVSALWSRIADGSIAQETYGYDDERWGRWVTTEQLLALARASDHSLEDAIRGQRYSAVDRAIVWLAARAGKTPSSPVTVTLHGLEQPVTLVARVGVRIGGADRIVATPLGAEFVRMPDGNRSYEWVWTVDQLRQQLEVAPPAETFAGIEFAPGAELGGGDRLVLPGGLWIEGMRAALGELEARA